MSALFSSVSWSVPEANARARAFLCPEMFRKSAKTAHERFYYSTATHSNHELNDAHEQLLLCAKSVYLWVLQD